MDRPESNDSIRSSGKLDHLEQLFLIAQFLSEDADQAALLVDRVYRSSNAETGLREESFSELIHRLLTLSRRHEQGDASENDSQKILGANHIRSLEAKRILSKRIKTEFLLLSPTEKVDLWKCVEIQPESAGPLSKDALDLMKDRIYKRFSVDEARLYEPFLSRETVSKSLLSFWNDSFIPVPPTLRSVVESGEQRLTPKSNRLSRSPTKSAAPNRRHPAKRLFWYTWAILGATVIGYLLTRVGQPSPVSNDFLVLSLEVIDDIDITFRTNSAEQSERFIQDRFGWRMTTPEIADAELVGISLTEIRESIELPVFVFSDREDESLIPVFAFSYSFLQEHINEVSLSPGTLRHIQESAQFDIHEMDETSAVIWRDRDDIFAAFVHQSGTDFQARILVRS